MSNKVTSSSEFDDSISKYISLEKYTNFDVYTSSKVLQLESTLEHKEKQKLWCFLRILHSKCKTLAYRRIRTYKGVKLAWNEIVISAEEWQKNLGSFACDKTEALNSDLPKIRKNKVVVKKSLKRKIEESGLLKITKPGWYNQECPEDSRATIYAIDPEWLQSKTTRAVAITNRHFVDSLGKWMALHAKPFTSIDRAIITQYHDKLSFDIDSKDFISLYQNEAEADAKAKGKDIDTDWQAGYAMSCDKIDEINTIKNQDKWLNTSVDPYGKRLHHALTYVPSEARQYARIVRKGKVYFPVAEIDLRTSQPFFMTCAAIKAGVRDEELIQDLENDLYTRYGERVGITDRKVTKERVFQSIFGEVGSPASQQMEKFYPQFVAWLNQTKAKPIDYYKEEIGANYQPYKNVSIMAQRTESDWARKVWRELHDKKIVFLPVHDSIIIFGTKDYTADDVTERIEEAVDLMQYYMQEAVGTVLKPRFHIDRMNADKISNN